MREIIRIGTRGSQLALFQANYVKDLILAKCQNISEENIEIIPIKTTGDIVLDKTLADIGGKSLFTKEIENYLLENKIDIAVHSLKDFTSRLPEGLVIQAYMEREDCRDAIVSKNGYKSIYDLEEGAIIGTSSCRRRAQLLRLRPDLKIMTLRGNINSRINKIISGEYDAGILAVAGLKRLNFDQKIYNPISIEIMLPAPGQGVICVECRKDDISMINICNQINHKITEIQVSAERGVLEALEADCMTPFAAYAELQNNYLKLDAHVYSQDGKELYNITENVDFNDAYDSGFKIGNALKKQIGEI